MKLNTACLTKYNNENWLIHLACLFVWYHKFELTKLKSMANQEITLQGFNGLQNYPIAKTKIDEKGDLFVVYLVV
jgi:hypothetical protein